ncbi:MAG: UDP-N-acetylmuramate dehydrogenase [Ferrovum sp.]|nr:UDP-N-acetylmuramate dehydrogenase [Ferrovum sp.]NDU86972.1 UDP-N-acetylmuramate dehydrogenase [Ferrovum sp.]
MNTLIQLRSGELRSHEPMSRHVSWRAGGAARYLYRPVDRADFISFLRQQPQESPILVFGLGSNLLVRDGGVEATVIQMHGALKHVVWESDRCLKVEAGVAAPKVARMVARAGRSGGEFLAGIPGTMGGALAMNAGCYGAETWSFVSAVETVDRQGRVYRRQPDDYHIGYRSVRLKETLGVQEEWFVAAWLCFPPGDASQASAQIRSLLARRVADQPLNLPNAGSVFRNPPGDYAARLIEACGLKGLRKGGAEVSLKHSNFIVNREHATARDIESLMAEVQARVWARYGVSLHPEVCIVGEPG